MRYLIILFVIFLLVSCGNVYKPIDSNEDTFYVGERDSLYIEHLYMYGNPGYTKAYFSGKVTCPPYFYGVSVENLNAGSLDNFGGIITDTSSIGSGVVYGVTFTRNPDGTIDMKFIKNEEVIGTDILIKQINERIL
jgi:hypothetical protein